MFRDRFCRGSGRWLPSRKQGRAWSDRGEVESVVGCDAVRLGSTGLGAEPFVECFDVGKLDPFGVVWKAFIVEHVSGCNIESRVLHSSTRGKELT